MKRERRVTPMLHILMPLVAGIIASQYCALPPLLSLSLFSLSLILFWLLKAKALIYPVVALFGILITSLDRPAEQLTQQYDATMVLKVERPPYATLISQLDESGEWVERNAKVIAWCDKSLNYTTIECRANIHPLGENDNSYYRTQQRKGYTARLSSLEQISTFAPAAAPLSARLNHWAMERLERLTLSHETLASIAAMGLARREGLSQEIVEEYNISGTSHLLALSGLHLSIVLLIISSLTYLLPLLHRGNILADIVAIVAIWLFALMVGMGDSVVRAAWMISLVRLSWIISRRYQSLNALLVSAVMILSFDPYSLFDVGFQLSFCAVGAIIVVGAPLTRLLMSRYVALNYVVASLVVGCVATLATAPLVSYYFGYVSLLSPIATPLLLPTLTIIIFCTTLWVICPLPPLAAAVSYILEVAATIQNHIVGLFASLQWGSFDFRCSAVELLVSYSIIIVFALFLTSSIDSALAKRRDSINLDVLE